jgi:dUTP pyrophosphatase
MEIKIKKINPEAKTPTLGTLGSAGYDLYSVEDVDMSAYYMEDKAHLLKTGLSMSIPDNYVGLIFPRSSLHKKHLTLANCVGVVDSDYRGEIKIPLKCTDNMDTNQFVIKGDRVAQIVFVRHEKVVFNEVDELDITLRNTGGFGSSGN